MCGIIAAFDRSGNGVEEWARNQLQCQLHRGREGFGLVRFGDGPTSTERSVEITGVLVPLFMEKASGILLHHRHPTSSANRISQTHPILVSNDGLDFDYLVAHNGTISNRKVLKGKHESEYGYSYTTDTEDAAGNGYGKGKDGFNDSECAAIELAMFADLWQAGKLPEKEEFRLRSEGGQALVAVRVDRKSGEATHLLFCRNDMSPLNFHRGGKSAVYLSSEGIGEPVEEHALFEIDLKTMKARRRQLEVPDGWKGSPVPERSGKRSGGRGESAYGDPCKEPGCVNYTLNAGGTCSDCLRAKSLPTAASGTDGSIRCAECGGRTWEEDGTCLSCKRRKGLPDASGLDCMTHGCLLKAGGKDPDGLCGHCRAFLSAKTGEGKAGGTRKPEKDGGEDGEKEGSIGFSDRDSAFLSKADVIDSIMGDCFDRLVELQRKVQMAVSGDGGDATLTELREDFESDLDALLSEMEDRLQWETEPEHAEVS